MLETTNPALTRNGSAHVEPDAVVRSAVMAVVQNVVGGRQHNIDLTESQFLKLARRVEHTAELDRHSLVSVHASMTGNGINKRVTERAQADSDHRTVRIQLITFWGSIPTADNTARAAFLPGHPETDPPGCAIEPV